MSKRKRFGSPPAMHENTAARLIKESVKFSRAAFKLARTGQCSRALDALHNAATSLGEARAHEESAGHGLMPTRYNKAGTINVKAGVAFRRSCIKR
jgi:hypothetical protein